ncbi:Imm26 family immunity protein (plasmid) [Paenarthrobacter sp. OM7]|uniref:Imm26 family immunity protein n=2 Tax=unclassified Paenarthrobacter TaxID=2634190 RepID=A0AB39YVA1_9MICC|nr:Imm26 family immunity protein [Paenarthrobacter sp. OM7]WGM22965.1 Imm26 family immunity protein [Paenarthrobacter sp. OM7]
MKTLALSDHLAWRCEFSGDSIPDAINSGPTNRQAPQDFQSTSGRVVAKPKYGPGSLFAVPLNGGGYGVGLVARMSSKGILLGYFFAQRWAQVPMLSDVKNLSPNDSVLIGRFSYLGLKQGQWEVLGPMAGWVPEEWPMPVFARTEPITGRSIQVHYDDSDPSRRLGEEAVPGGDNEGKPEDGLMGAGYVENVLTGLLAQP